jgi:tetratricopeptide (TPR) repeat protein
VDAHQARQVLLVELGRPNEAVAVLEQARKLDPLHPDLLWELTHLLNLQGRTDEAFRTLDTLESVNPSLARGLELHLLSDLGAVD